MTNLRTTSNMDELIVSVNDIVSKVGNINNSIVDGLNNISLITNKEREMLSETHDFVMESFLQIPSHRTIHQKYVGVLTNKNCPTDDSKYWQCKTETEVQFYELSRSFLAYKANQIDIDEILYQMAQLEESKGDPMADISIRRCEVALEEKLLNSKKTEKDIKHRIGEIYDWYCISLEYKDSIKYSSTNYEEHEAAKLGAYINARLDQSNMSETEKEIAESQREAFNKLLHKRIELSKTK